MFFDWIKRHSISKADAAACIGASPQSVSSADTRGTHPPAWDAFARVAEAAPLRVMFVNGGNCNQPLATFSGDPRAYGPEDVIRGDGRIAAHAVLLWAAMPDRTEEDYQMARRFLRFWPDGPQLR